MFKKILITAVALIFVAIIIAFAFGPGYLEKGINQVIEHEAYVISDEARNLHASLTAADLHSDTLLWHRDVLDRGNRGHVDVPRLIEGGVVVQVFSTVTKAPEGSHALDGSLGSDYDGATSVFFDTSELSALTQALLDAGLNEEEIRAVMGGNQIRFFQRYLPS